MVVPQSIYETKWIASTRGVSRLAGACSPKHTRADILQTRQVVLEHLDNLTDVLLQGQCEVASCG